MTNDENDPVTSRAVEPPADSQSEIDPRLLEILVCPQTRGPLVYDRAKNELLSKNAALAYPIRDSIPIMLTDEARPLTDEELNRL